jgi:putative addiction module CopG family antidote
MQISLSSEWREFVNAQVDAGLYGSVNDVLNEGLRLLHDANRRRVIEAINKRMEAAYDDIAVMDDFGADDMALPA